MQTVNSYTVSVCFVILLCTAFQMLMPSDKFKVNTRIISGIFILSVLVNPALKLIGGDIESRMSNGIAGGNPSADEQVENLQGELDSAFRKSVKRGMADEIEKCVSEKFSLGEKITADVSDDCLRVTLRKVPQNIRGEVSDIIKNRFGIEPQYTE